MSVNPIGKIFLKQENGVFPGIGSTVMEIAQRVIKEQETQVKNNGEKNLWTELSSGVATYFDQNHITEEQMEVINKNIEDVFGGRKVYIPDTVTKVVNGVTSEVHPNIDWWMIGNGRYPIGVQKEDEKYKIAVGPKIIDPEYPDDGKIQDDDFDGYSKNVKLILEHKVTGEEKIIECTVVDFKAHSYNTYPDGQPYNTGDIVSFDVENGLIQTGIDYPESSNAKKPGAFTKESSDGNIIEFAGHALDFDPNEYVLCHLIVVQ